jgi:hypothetical protein
MLLNGDLMFLALVISSSCPHWFGKWQKEDTLQPLRDLRQDPLSAA